MDIEPRPVSRRRVPLREPVLSLVRLSRWIGCVRDRRFDRRAHLVPRWARNRCPLNDGQGSFNLRRRLAMRPGPDGYREMEGVDDFFYTPAIQGEPGHEE